MVNDAVDQMAESLKNIETYLAINGMGGGGGGGGGSDTTGVSGGGVASNNGVLNPSKYVVTETDDLDAVTEGGSMTIQPGETKPLIDEQAINDGMAILAIGATDAADVRYQLVVDDNRVVGGTTNSPLGLLNEPFSFVEEFGAVIPVERRVVYQATLDGSASSSVELAARCHIERLG